MAETHNIAEMATKLARELFPMFYWEEIKPSDQNWNCVKEQHKKKTHPTDAVYRFNHPYTGKLTYIIFDFKSFANTSISPEEMGKAVRNLALTLDCAMVSDGWQNLYLRDKSFDIQGCLFVYNHDNDYKNILANQLNSNLKKNFPNNWPKLQKNHEITIVDPHTIIYLNSIYKDLMILSSKKQIPDLEFIGFYQPDKYLKSQKLTGNNHYKVPLMPEQLSSEIIIIRYDSGIPGKEGFIVYYRGVGDNEDEFIYLIDLLFTYQIIDHASEIKLRLINSNKYSNINLG
ncbi:MAG: hypothetical protein QM487_08085 [Candidatus Marithrix sp.]